MSKHHYDHIRGNKEFHNLVRQKSKLTWSLSALVLVVYYAFILVIAFEPGWLATPMSEGSTLSWGLPVGILVILFTFAVTGVYVHKANTLFDKLMQGIVDASNTHVNNLQATNSGATENNNEA